MEDGVQHYIQREISQGAPCASLSISRWHRAPEQVHETTSTQAPGHLKVSPQTRHQWACPGTRVCGHVSSKGRTKCLEIPGQWAAGTSFGHFSMNHF